MSDFAIEQASHRLCVALHMEDINPADIEVHLPRDAWWRLWTRLEAKYRGLMRFDGRNGLGGPPAEFQYMGIKYKAIDR